MSQKLDNFSKVLLATSVIQHMYNSIHCVNRDMRLIHHNMSGSESTIAKQSLERGIKEREAFLNRKLKQLNKIVEELGNHMNNTDVISAIDVRITQAPMEILLHGMDDVEEEYDDERSQPLPIDFKPPFA